MKDYDAEFLVDEVIQAAGDLANAYEWGSGIHIAQKRLEEAQHELMFYIGFLEMVYNKVKELSPYIQGE